MSCIRYSSAGKPSLPGGRRGCDRRLRSSRCGAVEPPFGGDAQMPGVPERHWRRVGGSVGHFRVPRSSRQACSQRRQACSQTRQCSWWWSADGLTGDGQANCSRSSALAVNWLRHLRPDAPYAA